MKRFIYSILFVICIFFTSCQMVTYRGTTEIKLPKGEKLVMATKEEMDIWFLTEPMDSNYVPKTKHLYESSLIGVGDIEGEIVFIESK